MRLIWCWSTLKPICPVGFRDPVPNRPSSLDMLDRKSFLELWEKEQLTFGGRSREELKFYADNGSWPEQRGRLDHSIQDGRLFVEWRNQPPE
jgi:hypothetical protein